MIKRKDNRKRPQRRDAPEGFNLDKWTPKTKLGKQVKSGEIKDIDFILDNGVKILEPGVVDAIMKDIETELLLVGQSKGKFGGGQRRVFKQTQKKTREGNKPSFSTFAVVGNHNGYVGLGSGKSKETVPAREKAFRNAKLNIMKITRGCGSWQCGCKEPHTIPFKIEGKCGSVKVMFMPAPKGTGLKAEKECQKILGLAGIKDVWSRTEGQTKSKNNLIVACERALKQLMATKINQKVTENLGLIEGAIKKIEVEPVEEKNE
jgi:small subunit ribosomal protein S5